MRKPGFRHSVAGIATAVALLYACSARTALSTSVAPALDDPSGPSAATGPCAIKDLKKVEQDGIVVPSPDGRRYLVNKEDAKGVAQIYSGNVGSKELTCVSCTQRPGGPRPDRFKLQPGWHPSGKWFFLGVERDTYSKPPILGWNKKFVEGMLRNGLWTNMWAVSADGSEWHRLTDFASGKKGIADGFTGPVLTHDGERAVWSQIIDGNIFAYSPFGRWEMMLADFVEENGIPKLINHRNITPPGMHWNEVGNFHPDNESLLFSGSDQKDQQGMDQYVLNIRTNQLRNLTKSPTVWDEHGRFSPNGQKIIWMSAHPYRRDPNASKVMSIKTEFMLMNSDGSGITQLTHFREKGYPESDKGGIAANPEWHPDGRSAHLRTLMFPDYIDWMVTFQGPCGTGLSRGMLPLK